ncbi:uncharacterized protein LOC109789491 [Cajanus cajan]|uniref:uncharacterized protein LOC109789491 n=1 Tax=Cajanus cajan TaxID=3821 RepID=UPI00098DAB1A|nr:uncharacterized protein LOC109789491 [Cajanus cajan]
MDSDAATLRRLIDQVEQMRQQHDTDLRNLRAQHENDLAAIRAANEVDLAALRAENEHIRAQLPRRPSNNPPHESNAHEDEAHSASHSRTTTKAPTSRPTTHRVFPTSLRGAALPWYTQLPARSIDSFNTLIQRFTVQYAISRPHHTTSTTLANLRQNDDEPLRTFMERFSSISVRIRNLNPEVACTPCSWPSRQAPSLTACAGIPLATWTSSVLARPGTSRWRSTPLSMTRVHILEEASNINLFALPPPGHTPNSADKSKHCRYHRNYGHTTEECRTLKDRIKELIQAGHLGQYVQRQQGNRGGYGGRGRGRGRGSGTRTDPHPGSQQNASGAVQAEISQETESAPLQGVINTIAGGFAGGGASSSARRRHLLSINCIHSTTSALHQSSSPISFSNEDYAGVSPNQDDPMVIVVEIANWKVQKTLIDQGSSADVLYWPTFLKMKANPKTSKCKFRGRIRTSTLLLKVETEP